MGVVCQNDKNYSVQFSNLGTCALALDIFPDKTLNLRTPKSFCPFQTNYSRNKKANISTYKLIQHQESQEVHILGLRIFGSERDAKGSQYF